MPRRALVIDDEPSIRFALQLALEDAGFEVDTVGSAEEALALQDVRRHDILLTDKDLPGLSGIDLTRKLRSAGDTTPIIMITGHASTATAIEALNLGIDGYLEKPFPHVDQVVRVIEAVLRRQAPQPGATLARVWRALGSRRGAAPLRILVAASSPEVRRHVSAALAGVNGEVAEGASAAEALDIAARASPNLAVLDGTLDHDISDLVADLLARTPRTAIVIMNAQPSLPTVERLTTLGVKAVLTEAVGTAPWRQRLSELVASLAADR